MMRIIVLSLSLLFICTAAMAASDSELARQYMAEHPLPITLPSSVKTKAAIDGPAAKVKTFTGTATITRKEKVIPASRDEKIYIGDTLKTGAEGSIGITFRDNTILSLGPNSVVVIQEFLFAPAQGKLSIVTRLMKGTAAYLSGVIAKLSPQSVRFETPVATVGFRGTKILVKIEDGEQN
jgi:hypothetical protein